MNENAKKWITALKSGEYSQTTEELGSPDKGFCCLGVACKVYEEETGDKLPKLDGLVYDGGDLDYGFKPVREWLGLNGADGSFYQSIPYGKHSSIHSLVGLNDTAEWNFQQIAEFVETEPAGLFATEGAQDE